MMESLPGKLGSRAAFIKDAGLRDLIVKDLGIATGGKLTIYGASICTLSEGLIVAAREGQSRKLIVCGAANGLVGAKLSNFLVCDANAANMATLRKLCDFLR